MQISQNGIVLPPRENRVNLQSPISNSPTLKLPITNP
jgi:hypothetical protein